MVVKNLKVICPKDLSSDGTFQIGLRDALMISKNSRVTLDKFVYKQKTQGVVPYVVDASYTIIFNPDAHGTPQISTPAIPRSLTFPVGTYKNANEVLSTLSTLIAKSLQTGDVLSPKNTALKYFVQDTEEPTIDAGLDIISYIDTKSGNVNINFESFTLGEVHKSADLNNVLYNENVFTIENETALWAIRDQFAIVKAGFQFEATIKTIGDSGNNYYIGLLDYNRRADQLLTFPQIDIGFEIYDNKYVWIDTGVSTATNVSVESEDKIVMFIQGGKLTGFVWSGDVYNATIKYTIPPSSNFKVGNTTQKYRGAIYSTLQLQYTIMPSFSDVLITNINPITRTLKRTITLDFKEAGTLANELGLSSTFLESEYETIASFFGVAVPSFFALQDISIYWSLPMQTFFGSSDNKRNSREKLVGSFSPERTFDRYDSLIYNSNLPFVSIGNNELINISSLSFRIINEYTGKAINSSYLSFNLIIKDEEEH